MSTMQLLLIFLPILRGTSALFDIDELKTFNYGIDIRSEPVVMKPENDEEDLSTVKLTSKYGQLYECSFPNTNEREKQKEEAEKVAMETGIPDLLKPMGSGPCLRKTKDWWSYEFCYGKHIKQFHLADDGRIEGEVLSLGYYESEYNWEDDYDKATASEKKETKMRRYHTQQYVNGTKCDLNGNLRRTEVRFMCEEGGADYISRLDEPETCSYIMTIHTMKICHHPFLKPPTPTKTVAITCNPLLTIVQYQSYLDDLEAREERQRVEEEKRQAEADALQAEKDRLAEQKAKYYKENQLHAGEVDDDGLVEEEIETIPGVERDVSGDGEKLLADQWDKILNAAETAAGDDDLLKSKTMFKVVESPEDLKDFLKEALAEVKKVKAEKLAKIGADDATADDDDDEEEEEEGDVEDDVKKPSLIRDKPPHFDPIDLDEELEEEEEDPDVQELDQEIKTLKEKYKLRREKLTEFKQKVKANMEANYEAIIKEAQEELGEDGFDTNLDSPENRDAIKQLTKTIDNLLNKLDKTEKEIAAVDKELEQFAEYDGEEKVKSIPPVKDTSIPTTAQGPDVPGEGHEDRVKVRVSRLKPGQKKAITDTMSNKQTEALEKSVQKELEKAGLGSGETIQVKIITTSYDGDDDTLHVLSEQESETFRNMIVDMIGGTSEVDREQARHDQLEENYSFVWGQDAHTDKQTDSVHIGDGDFSGDTQNTGLHSETQGVNTDSDTNTRTDKDSYLNTEDEGS